MKRPLTRDLGTGLLLLCGLLIFVPNLNGYFLADDFVLLSWTQAGSLEDVAAFFDPGTPWFYRPGVKVIYWVGQSLFGLHAAPFHLLSLLLHGANGYLVYRLVARHRKGQVGWLMGLSAGLVFLLNPRHAETVSWIAAVGDLVAAFCILSALLLFFRFRESPRLLYLLGSLAFFTLGLFTRETAVVFPALMLLALGTHGTHGTHGVGAWRCHAPTGVQPTAPRRFLPLAAYLAPLLGYLAVQSAGRSGEAALARGGLQFRALNADSMALGVMDYVHGLAPGGSVLSGLPLDTLRVIVWVELAVIALLALALWRVGWRVTLFGLGWLMLTPLLFVFFNAPTDRYYYLPSIGYAIAAGAFVAQIPSLAAKWRLPLMPARLAAALLAAALLVPQGIGLATKERAWHVAGQASGGVFHDVRQAVPDPPSRTHFYFVDLPPFLGSVPTFQNSLPHALQLLYRDGTLAASPATCEELREAEMLGSAYIFRFKGDGAQQLTSAQECSP